MDKFTQKAIRNGWLLIRLKYIVVFFIIFFTSNYIHSQNSITSEAEIEYTISKNMGDELYQGVLYFNNKQSVFRYKYSKSTENVDVMTSEEEGNSVNIEINVTEIDTTYQLIYVDRFDKKIVEKGLDFLDKKNSIYVVNSLPVLKWNLVSDKKLIGSYECNKATLTLGDQKLVAWYSPSIPSFFGPLDFGQLPGLILELYSLDYEFHISAISINYPQVREITIPNFKNENCISQEEYDGLVSDYLAQKNNETLEKINRVLTKSSRGVKISNIKVESSKQ